MMYIEFPGLDLPQPVVHVILTRMTCSICMKLALKIPSIPSGSSDGFHCPVKIRLAIFYGFSDNASRKCLATNSWVFDAIRYLTDNCKDHSILARAIHSRALDTVAHRYLHRL